MPSYYQDAIPASTITAPYLLELFLPTAALNYPPNVPLSEPYPYPVWVYGTDILTHEANDVPALWPTATLYNLAQALATTLLGAGGNGLAAPQAGMPWKMFIVRTSLLQQNAPNFPLVSPAPPLGNDTYQIFINPVVKANQAQGTWLTQEMCMSIPAYPGNASTPDDPAVAVNTTRYQQFTITYQTLTFKKIAGVLVPDLLPVSQQYTSTYNPSLVNVNNGIGNEPNWLLQHEADHVMGILFTERSTGTDQTPNSTYLAQIAAGNQGGVYK